jgi:hypothetical protein
MNDVLENTYLSIYVLKIVAYAVGMGIQYHSFHPFY